MEELVAVALYYTDVEGGTADGDACLLVAGFAASVDGNEEVVATAAHLQGDFPIVSYHNGAHVQAVWCYGSDGKYARAGYHDGTSYAQRVGRRAGGSGYDQSVGLIGRQIVAVHTGVDGYHGRGVALQYGYLVQGKGVLLQPSALGGYMQGGTLLHLVVVVDDVAYGIVNLFGPYVGEEAQSSGVHSQDGDAPVSDAAGRTQESAVASHADGHVGIELIAFGYQAVGFQVHSQFLCQKAVKSLVHIHFALVGLQQVDDMFGMSRLFGLESISEEGKFHVYSC